jgi:hypothetical protein
MIDYTLDKENSVLHVRATGPLRENDFDTLAGAVDPFIEQTGGLGGLILETPRFPGWENLDSVARHFRFVRDHHRKVKKVAVVTDSPLGEAAEHIASHFVSAEIKHFSAGQIEEAKAWIGSG